MRAAPLIRILAPTHEPDRGFVAPLLARMAIPGVRLDYDANPSGPGGIRTDAETAQALPGLVAAAERAQAEGASAVVIDCTGDTGVAELRGRLRVPVVGPGLASVQAAALLAGRFGVAGHHDGIGPLFRRHARAAGWRSRLAAVRLVEAAGGEAEQATVFAAAIESMVHDAEVGAVILGSTALSDVAPAIGRDLRRRGVEAHLVDPLRAAVSLAAALVLMQMESDMQVQA